MIDPQPVDQHAALRLDHVVIIIMGKGHAQAVAGLGGITVADIVGQDDEIAAHVERLAGAIKFVGKLRLQELRARSAGAVQDHHRIVDPPLGVAMRRADGAIMHPQFRQLLTRTESKVADDMVALLDLRGIEALRQCRRGEQQCGSGGEPGPTVLHVLVLPWNFTKMMHMRI